MTDARGPARGESDVEIAVRETEDDEAVEYVEEDHAVRYVARWRHSNHEAVREGGPAEREPVHETTPFERWGETQCLVAAGRVAAERVNDQLGIEEVSGGITSLGTGDERVAFVSVETTLNRTGGLLHEPSVAFDALVAATPAAVDVTYRLGDRTYRMDAPVYARHDVCQLD